MNTVTVYIKNSNRLMPYLRNNMSGSRAVRNAANFLIRNTYTALHKPECLRTANENAVLLKVCLALNEANHRKKKEHERKIAAGKEHTLKLFPMPDEKHSMLSYGQLDAILKITEDPDYYSCTSQVNQQAIKKTCASWKAYFAALRKWKANPSKFLGKPRIPGYIRGMEATAHFTTQVSSLIETGDGYQMSFANTKDRLDLGRLPVSGIYVKTEFCPCASGCRAMITFDDGRVFPEVPENAERILAIDPGVDNFAACVSNTGAKPFLIDGKYIKSVNHYYNKRLAYLKGRLTAGKDPKDSSVKKSTRAIAVLSERRDKVLRDWFYKSAHHICHRAKQEGITLILFGHNEAWKQECSMGRQNNQNFVQIPYMKFYGILQCVAAKYGIAVDQQEESYTSQSDFFCMDEIPVYGKESGPLNFSGKRVNRGLYRSGSGKMVNADINGSANILRKRFPAAFDEIKTDCLLSVTKTGRRELYPSYGRHQSKNKKHPLSESA